ncbi:hypothetical protein A2881_01105 [Candidatus Peribacteria bacterium RIFCSPHIGHO2_01_FULL_55_13]|nr:MAG: hypothetical protein A2881_01105 [Candidatus Peribacteria bacterium RIFCSPHIGHO2_01_FULL_55_13]OGJ64871.1 MAG: hypothetical protein A3F36_00410 [Candidatus Peribacteria bacterium RIFCSPHIGHO2_12_FULL_55_11]
MSEFGGIDIGAPGEGIAGAPEQLSEEAKQRFAAAAAAMAQIRREEKRSKKRDDQVARVILQFLAQDSNTHLFLLISRLVARDCPSIFILSVISLIDEGSFVAVQEYLQETLQKTAKEAVDENMPLLKTGTLDAETNRVLIEWITRMQMVMALDPERILVSLMLDEKNIDGTILQLATFVLQEFFLKQGKATPFDKVQPLAGSILQTVFEPFVAAARQKLLESKAQENSDGE